MRRLLLDREAVARGVELRDAVPLGVLDPVGDDLPKIVALPASSALRTASRSMPVKPAPWKILSPSTRQTESPPMNSSPIRNACASPSGEGCSAYSMLTP